MFELLDEDEPQDVDAAARWLAEPEPTLIIIGSGISLDAPSSAPSVWPFLHQTLDLLQEVTGFTPEDNDASTGYRSRIFPESCYGAITEAFGTDSLLRIWEVFNQATAAGLGARPNSGHLAVARLAAANGWPVITTNYDCFIETAAAQATR